MGKESDLSKKILMDGLDVCRGTGMRQSKEEWDREKVNKEGKTEVNL